MISTIITAVKDGMCCARELISLPVFLVELTMTVDFLHLMVVYGCQYTEIKLQLP